ncbi:MAG TPA: hypothetical protein VGK46_07140 [Saprospiraceae bacterium]
MPISRPIAQVSFGGSAVNNPINYSWSDYRDYPNLDVKVNYVRMNISYFSASLQINLQVTGLVVLDDQGLPKMGLTDVVYLPCPPECQ